MSMSRQVMIACFKTFSGYDERIALVILLCGVLNGL